MKKTLKLLYIITIAVIAVTTYLLGTTQEKTITEIKEVVTPVEVVPDDYINTTTKDFQNNYIDLNTVSSYIGTSNGLQLYTSNGNVHYLDIEKEESDITQVYYVESENDFDTLLDALENRNGKIIIEVINGTVNDMEGNGIDINGYYIKYDNTRFLKGDQVQTILIYNPDTNSTDDILYRIDTLIK